MERTRARTVAGIAALAVAYFAGAQVGLWPVRTGSVVTALWPHAGIALAAILLGGYRLWPGIVIGEVASSLVSGLALPALVCLAVGNTGQVLLAAWLLRGFAGFRNSLDRVRDVLSLVVVGSLITMLGALVGVATQLTFSGMPASAAGTFWFTWWFSDAIGVLLLTPVIVTWATWKGEAWSPRRVAEAGVLVAVLAFASFVVFTGLLPQPYVIAPVLVWAALRFGQHGTCTAIALVSAFGIAITARGRGPFVGPLPAANMLELQAFLGVVAVTTMLLAAILAERQAARDALERAFAEVESRVRQRTTELESANAALQLAQTQWSQFLEASPDLMWIKDTDGRYVAVNDVFLRFHGTRRDEVLGQMDRFHADQLQGEILASDAVAVRDGAYQGEFVERQAGRDHVLHVKKVRLNDAEGRLVGTLGLARDITERKKIEERLLQTQKMDAVGNLAGGVAHDFNNVLQAMLGLTQLLRLNDADAERRLARLTELEDHIQRGSRLTRQLLLFSRQEAVRPETLDLNEAVLEAEVLLRRLLRANIALENQLAAGRLPVEIDRSQLNQVVMNLAVNAADAMPGGGRLAFRSRAEGSSWVRLVVEDTGHGIPDEVRGHIFEPFFTTKGAGKGTGLGLAVVHGIVTQYGGTIEVESGEGAGTAFSLLFPRAASDPGEVRNAEPLADEIDRGHGERILVVEDELAARQGLGEILGMLGYEAVAVGSGEEAGLLPARPGFDVLLTDLMLPGVSGMDLRSGLQDRWPDLGVILMSGYPQDEALRGQVHSGDVRFLQKPFGIAQLARELRAALADRAASPT